MNEILNVLLKILEKTNTFNVGTESHEMRVIDYDSLIRNLRKEIENKKE